MIRLGPNITALFCVLWAGSAQAADASRHDAFGVFGVPNDPRSLTELEALGVGWVRQQFRLGEPYRQRRQQHFVTRILPQLLAHGIGLWVTFYHRDPSNIIERGTVGYRAAKRGGFPPANVEKFQALVRNAVVAFRNAVRRSGRTPGKWLVFQFGNEVLPFDIHPPDKAVRFWHGTAEQYLAMLALAHDAAKSVDPDIPVAAGGISSAAMEAIQSGHGAIEEWNDRLLRHGKFDIAAVHLRHRLADIPAKIAWVRARWRGPLAATEIAGPDPRVATFTEAAQARDLRQRLTLARRHGVDRVFWAALADSFFVRPVHRQEGLIEPQAWRRKPAFEAYRRLISETPVSAR